MSINPTYLKRQRAPEYQVPILDQVDDIIGIAEAGLKSTQLNVYINVKTSDKELQFGPTKCKTMIVSKVKPQIFHKPELKVDSWEIIHEKNGKVNIDEETSMMYLGFMLSKDGNNMKNIIHKQNKTIGTKKTDTEVNRTTWTIYF